MENMEKFFKRIAEATPELRAAIETAKQERRLEEIEPEEYNPITGEYEPNPEYEILNWRIPLDN